jgi:hypothetical protein
LPLGRATVGHLGLYVVDRADKIVLRYDLPLDLDNTRTPNRDTAASGLDAPIAVAAMAVAIPGALKPEISVLVSDGAAIKTFDDAGTLKSTLTGPTTLLSAPISLVIAPDPVVADKRLLLVCDSVSGILVFDPSAAGDVAPVKRWTFTKATVTDIAVDSKGNLVYTEGASIHTLPLSTDGGADPTPASTITSANKPLAPVAISVS